MQIKQIDPRALTPYARNTKKHDQTQIDNVAESIRQFGFVQPVVVDKDNTIVIGHCRVLASIQLGMDTVPCVAVDELTPEQVQALRIVDNKTNESPWDFAMLELELPQINLGDFDFGDLGVAFEIEKEREQQPEIVEDEVPEVDEENEPIVKFGDIWQLGRHRLMCGDSTDKETVELLMDGQKADLLLTDPPYGINADKGFSGSVGFAGKGKPIPRRKYKDEWDEFTPPKECFAMILECCERAIIFGGNFFTDKIPQGNHWLVWNKHNTMPTFSDAELAWTNIQRNSVKIYDVEYNGLIGKEKERFHPTQKPIKLFAPILEDYSKQGEIVLDTFGGSGSTLIACEQLDRTCYMMELDPKYCDVIIKRWEILTGRKAVKITTRE